MSRWSIRTSLRTNSRLVVGSGTATELIEAHLAGRHTHLTPAVLVSDVQVDAKGRATIPGASLRGACRAWIRRNFPNSENSLFGSASDSGGKISFRWALVSDTVTADVKHFDDALWDPTGSLTAVDASVSLNAESRTSSEHLLRHYRYVPAGVDFVLELVLVDVTDVELEQVLACLVAMGQPSEGSPRLGAKRAYRFGDLTRTRERLVDCFELRRLQDRDAIDWLTNGAEQIGGRIGRTLDSGRLARLLTSAKRLADAAANRSETLRLELALRFDERLLVKSLVHPDGKPGLSKAKRDGSGRALLPSASFRGAMRAQAARIARTISQQEYSDSSPLACGHHGVRGPKCGQRTVDGLMRDLDDLCVVCSLFGATGWHSPLRCTDFKAGSDVDNGHRLHVKHVAIDRYLGGASESRLFETDARFKPILKGSISIDYARLALTGKADAAIGLLLLVLRDLAEGDIAFGSGRSRGFGWCHGDFTATVVGTHDNHPLAALNGLKIIGAEITETLFQATQPFVDALRRIEVGGDRRDRVADATVPLQTGHLPQLPSVQQPTVRDTQFINPYHFIPKKAPADQRWSRFKEDGSPVDPDDSAWRALTHALYRRDCFSGRIMCRLIAETDVLIGKKRGDEREGQPVIVEPFAIDNRPAIPGSSIRGMLVTLGEGASNSALRVLTDSMIRKEGPSVFEIFSAVDNELLPFNRFREWLSPAEMLFGWVREDDIDGDNPSDRPFLESDALRAFASRVVIGTALPAVPRPNRDETPAVFHNELKTLRMLASPKLPSPATNLLPTRDGKAFQRRELRRDTARPQGAKAYVRGDSSISPYTDAAKLARPHLHVSSKPLVKGATFSFEVRFDNLTVIELGLLVYALRPSDPYRHLIGMGKSIGLGGVRIDIESAELVPRYDRYANRAMSEARSDLLPAADIKRLRTLFELTMDLDIRQAIRVIGESTSLRRVLAPHLTSNPDAEQFAWSMRNEAGPRQHMTPLGQASTSLPVLQADL